MHGFNVLITHPFSYFVCDCPRLEYKKNIEYALFLMTCYSGTCMHQVISIDQTQLYINACFVYLIRSYITPAYIT